MSVPCIEHLNVNDVLLKVVRAGLNIEIAPDLIANQLNVRYGALVLQVGVLSYFLVLSNDSLIVSIFFVND